MAAAYDLTQVARAAIAQRNDRGWGPFHTPKELATAIAVETAALQELFLWSKPESADDVRARPELIAAVEGELADVLLHCLTLADDLVINIATAAMDRVRRNEQRYTPAGPKLLPGTATHALMGAGSAAAPTARRAEGSETESPVLSPNRTELERRDPNAGGQRWPSAKPRRAAPSRSAGAKANHRVTLDDLLAAGLIGEGARIELTHRNRTFAGTVEQGQVVVDGQAMGTLSGAARTLKGGIATNGWREWYHRGRALEEYREEYLRTR